MTMRLPVWIDTDPTVFPGGHEVDDGIAIALTFRSPELDVIGVSSIFGNGPIDRCHESAQAVVAAFGPVGMSVHRGAAIAGDFSATPAAHAIIAAVRATPPPGLTIVALGPLTNIAAALALAPELAERILRIIWVAGRLPGQQFRASSRQEKPFPDLNFEADVAAADAVLASTVRIALTAWTVCSQVHFGRSQLARLARGDHALRWLHDPISDWLDLWNRDFGLDYFMPFDTLAVAVASGIGNVTGFEGRAWIERGSAPTLIAAPTDGGIRPPSPPRDIWFATGVDRQFIGTIIGRITTTSPCLKGTKR